MGQSLAVKYRPTDFSEVVGQDITITILKKAIETHKLSNTILLSGKSGCGKTTLARLIAKKINNNLGDPIEIDAASISSNCIENVHNIIDSAKERALVGEYKIFIIDECHAITGPGWQAFLKGIEEAPKYTIFLFCTTNSEKIPETILNRVQRYNILPIPAQNIKARLNYICQQEGFTNFEQTCDLISKTCGGGMRDAIATLEQCANFSTDLSLGNTKQILGESNYETMFKLTWALQQKNEKQILEIIDSMYNTGKDLKQFISIYLDFVLDLQKYILFNDINLTVIPEYLATKDNAVVQFTVKEETSLVYFRKLADHILNIKQAIKYDNSYKSTIEVMLLAFSRGE